MFNLDTFTTILVAIAPALSAIVTIIAGVVNIRNKVNSTMSNNIKQVEQINSQSAYDISIIKSKLASIENQMSKLKKGGK